MVAYPQSYADPDMMGMQMWTGNPQIAFTDFQVATGTFDVALVMCRRNAKLTKLGAWVQSGASTPIGGDVNGLAIYSCASDGAGALLGQTADMSTAFESAGFAEGSLTASVSVTAGKPYYLALLTAYSVTEPTIMGFTTAGQQQPEIGGLYASAYILSQAAWPASFTLADLTADTGTCFQTAR